MSPEPTVGGGASPGRGLSTGGKLFLGCLGLVVMGGLFAVLTLGAGALFVGKAARGVVAEVRGGGDAGEQLRRLEERHAFEAPADGVVGPQHVQRLERAVDAVWVRLEPLATSLDAPRESGAPPRDVREALDQVRGGMQGLQDMRGALADGLEEAGISLQEFLWTAGRLVGAGSSLGLASAPEGIPEENREMARRHRALVESLRGEGGADGRDRSAVLAVAMGAGGILALEEIWTR